MRVAVRVHALKLRPLFVVGLLVSASASAQPDPTPTPAPEPAPPAEPTPAAQAIAISGRVIDALGRPVRGATVVIEGTTDTATTGRDGRYRFAHAALGATIVVDKTGFETSLGSVSGASIDDIVMVTEAQSQETIEISGEPPPDSPGSTKIDRAEAERIPGTGGDLVRTLSAMPGIVNTQLPTGFSGLVIHLARRRRARRS